MAESDGVNQVDAGSQQQKLHQFSPREVADELCLMDAELLRRIAPTELEGGAWMKKDKKHTVSPNVMAMVGMFNQLALIVPTDILAEPTSHARSKVISAYIKIASKCEASHNYNSLKAVLAGLQCTPIFRLNKSWKEVSSKRKKRFQALTKLMSEEQNWAEYRRELEPRLANKFPFIPFLGVFLTDVALSQEASSMSKKREHLTKQRSDALYETYAILEPITIRHRLEKLRSVTSQDESNSVGSVQSDETDSFFSCKSSPSPLVFTPVTSPAKVCLDSVEEWDVGQWLTEMGLQQYVEGFVDNGYETIELCANLTGKDMTAIGITDKSHRSILHNHARKLSLYDTCPEPNGTVHESAPLAPRPKLKSLKSQESFNRTLGGSLECLISAVKAEGTHSHTYRQPEVLAKSSSLQSLPDQELSSEGVVSQSHKRTQSDTPLESSKSTGTHRRVHSDTSHTLQSFTGLPPQLPLHSQSSHGYSPNKETKAKSEASPVKDTSSKFKSWLQDRQHKGSLALLRRRSRELIHTSSTPQLTTQRARRDTPIVPELRLAHSDVHTSNARDPMTMLSVYQFLSLGCSNETESNRSLRDIITTSTHNTEAQNYKISYQLEAD